MVSHRYLKLVSVFYSNLNMSDETSLSQGLIGFTMIKNDDHQQVYLISESWSANKTGLTKTEEDEWARWYAVTIDCMSKLLKKILGTHVIGKRGRNGEDGGDLKTKKEVGSGGRRRKKSLDERERDHKKLFQSWQTIEEVRADLEFSPLQLKEFERM
ncbi:hypothetical protein V8G54_034161 [Vigna mungo]|uniref:Uncharacterized protein n=1 Tax=Vigna mungo TaxID=3915 RepID=A0AAQ3RH14_VIGMU